MGPFGNLVNKITLRAKLLKALYYFNLYIPKAGSSGKLLFFFYKMY